MDRWHARAEALGLDNDDVEAVAHALADAFRTGRDESLMDDAVVSRSYGRATLRWVRVIGILTILNFGMHLAWSSLPF